MTWHFPEGWDGDDKIERIITYVVIWFLLAGLWKTLEVFAFLGKFIKWP